MSIFHKAAKKPEIRKLDIYKGKLINIFLTPISIIDEEEIEPLEESSEEDDIRGGKPEFHVRKKGFPP